MNHGTVTIVLVFEERGKPEYLEKKPLIARERTNSKINPDMWYINTRIRTWARLVGGECYHL